MDNSKEMGDIMIILKTNVKFFYLKITKPLHTQKLLFPRLRCTSHHKSRAMQIEVHRQSKTQQEVRANGLGRLTHIETYDWKMRGKFCERWVQTEKDKAPWSHLVQGRLVQSPYRVTMSPTSQ